MKRLILLALLALAVVPVNAVRARPADWAQPILSLGIDNFHKVSDDVYRSAQPDQQQMRNLGLLGIASVLNLRKNHSDDEVAAGTSLNLYRVPMSAEDIRVSEIAEAVRILNECPKPVLVHCWLGADRTGCVIAVYRMVFQDWSKEKAIDEMINGGFGFNGEAFPNIEAFLTSLDVQALKASVGRPVESAP